VTVRGRADELDRVEARLAVVLPIHDVVTQVWRISRTGAEKWVVRHRIDLGQPHRSAVISVGRRDTLCWCRSEVVDGSVD
jgi:hypothetical protein